DRRSGGRAARRADRRVGEAGRVAASRRPVRHAFRRRGGRRMKGLWRYLEGRKLRAALMVLVGAGNAAAQTGGWLLVRDAIDNGIVAGDKRHLTIIVAIYLVVAAAGWLLQAWLIRGLAVIALLIADWRLGLISFAVLPPALILSRWFQRVSHAANVEQRNRIAAVTAQIAESVAGMAIVQAFNRERRFQAEFDALNDANRAQSTYVQKIFSVFFPSIEFLGVLATGAVLYVGAHFYAHHTLTIGTLITAIYLLQLVFQPLQELSDVYGQLQSAGAAMVKIASILDEEPEIRDRPDARPLP